MIQWECGSFLLSTCYIWVSSNPFSWKKIGLITWQSIYFDCCAMNKIRNCRAVFHSSFSSLGRVWGVWTSCRTILLVPLQPQQCALRGRLRQMGGRLQLSGQCPPQIKSWVWCSMQKTSTGTGSNHPASAAPGVAAELYQEAAAEKIFLWLRCTSLDLALSISGLARTQCQHPSCSSSWTRNF